MGISIGTAISALFGIKRLFDSRPKDGGLPGAQGEESDLLDNIEEAVLVAQRAGLKWARSGEDRRAMAADLIEVPVCAFLKRRGIDQDPGDIRPALETIAGGVYDLLVKRYGDKLRRLEGDS